MSEPRLIELRVAESVAAKSAILEGDLPAQTEALADVMIATLRAGGKIVFFGNGGSAADATHLAAELVGRYTYDRPPLAALSLTDNASSMSGIGNDYSYAETFARQIEGLGRPGDVAIGLSTSGTSPNVVQGVERARAVGMTTAAFCGAGGGDLAAVTEHCLRMPSTETPRIQECYMLVGHVLCEIVERSMFPR